MCRPVHGNDQDSTAELQEASSGNSFRTSGLHFSSPRNVMSATVQVGTIVLADLPVETVCWKWCGNFTKQVTILNSRVAFGILCILIHF